jgi:excisionase family DNA binding protein
LLWLTVSEASRFLGVSEPTLRKWTDAGRVAAFRTPGGHRRYRLENLIRFRDDSTELVDDAEDGGR